MNRQLRLYIIPNLLLLTVIVAFLFLVKNKVTLISKEISQTNQKIIAEKEALHILNAEYSFLSNPKRIKKLVDQRLHLQAMKKSQIIDVEKLEGYLNGLLAKPDIIEEGPHN